MLVHQREIPVAAPTSQQVQLQELRQMLNDVRETSPEEMRQIRQATADVRPERMATADAVDGVVQERSYGLWRRLWWFNGDLMGIYRGFIGDL